MTPARLLDTRPDSTTIDGEQAGNGKVAADTTIEVPIAGRGDIPESAASIAANITTVNGEGPGHVTAWDCSEPRPEASTNNFTDGSARPNEVLLDLSDDGSLCLYVFNSATDIIIDVGGSFPVNSDFATVTPARLLDTRPDSTTIDGEQAGNGKVAADTTIEVPIAGRGDIPESAASIAANITTVNGEGPGHVTAWDCSEPRPEASTNNFTDGSARPNEVLLDLSDDGSLCLYVFNSATDIIIDVGGSSGV